jgi:hypothetical protein
METLENSRNRGLMDGKTYFGKILAGLNIGETRSEYTFYRKFVPLKNKRRVMLAGVGHWLVVVVKSPATQGDSPGVVGQPL